MIPGCLTTGKFALAPFGPPDAERAFFAEFLASTDRLLRLRFTARLTSAGDAARLGIPADDHPETSGPGERVDRLWEKTCFEGFITAPGGTGYLEFNGAPDGDYQVYAFSGYREGMRPAPLTAPPGFRRRVFAADPRFFSVEFEWTVDLTAALREIGVSGRGELRCGMTAVAASASGRRYWALAHSGSAPDFHRCEDFRAVLPGDGE